MIGTSRILHLYQTACKTYNKPNKKYNEKLNNSLKNAACCNKCSKFFSL